MDNISIFSQRFKLLFNEMDVSQQKFTDKYLELYPYDSLSREMVSNYLNGKNLPPMNTIINLSKMLDVSSDFLLGLSDRKEYKDIQYISDTIGLSKKSIITLKECYLLEKEIERHEFLEGLDKCISSDLGKDFLKSLNEYMKYKETFIDTLTKHNHELVTSQMLKFNDFKTLTNLLEIIENSYNNTSERELKNLNLFESNLKIERKQNGNNSKKKE